MGIINLFSESGTPSTLLFLSLVGISGILLGKIKIFNVKLGIAGVLFTGLLVGHLGARSNAEPCTLSRNSGSYFLCIPLAST